MATVTKRALAVVAYDNRLPICSDVSAQIELALTNGLYTASAVTTTELVKATMTAPSAGLNRVVVELQAPDTVLDADIVTLVTNAILGLSIQQFTPYLTVNSVTVF